MGDKTVKTYEMLWNCEYCDTKKLLGKTHRHCPNCGAVQNPDKRYFPSDDEKVAVEDHQFVGADRHCSSCKAPNSAKSLHCTECGAPMDGTNKVNIVNDTPPPAVKTAPKKSKLPWIIAAVVVLVIATVCVCVFWKTEAMLSVSGRTWERKIAIERFAPLPSDSWCDSMPSDAYNVSRNREIRSYNNIPDGETCTTKRSDNGDGTFSERQVCTPKYRKEPVYDDKCRYTVNRWSTQREVRSAGKDPSVLPSWPQVTVPAQASAVLGAERQGQRTELYTVLFANNESKIYSCDFPEAKWGGYAIGSKWKGNIGVITDSLDCSSIMNLK